MTRTEKILARFGLVKKETAKLAAEKMFKLGKRQYAAGVVNRLSQDWLATTVQIDGDIRNYLVPVRERARNLVKNSAFARRFVKLAQNNVVGPYGFKLQMNVREYDPASKKLVVDKIANDKIEQAWHEWCKEENCTTTGKFTFRDVCNLLVSGKKIDGESIVRMVRTKKNKFRFALELIPVESLDEKYTTKLDNGNVVIMGVELDKWRRPVNYYFKKYDPQAALYGNTYTVSDHDIVPAGEVIHYFTADFVDQTRAVSEMAAAMLALHNLKGFNEASVLNARYAASKGVLFERPENSAEEFEGDDKDTDGNFILDVEPGMAQVLPPGFKAMQFSPEYPSAMHDSFNKSMLKEVSAGWNIAFASMSNDLSEANYSSNRVGLLDERSHWKAEQQEFTDKILSRIFPHWLEMALLTQIDLPDFKFEKFNSATWTGRKWDWIDPESDLNSIQTELYMRLKSPFDLAAERGEDFEQILQDFAEAKKLAEKYGVAIHYDDPKIVVAEKKNETPPATNGKALALNGAGHLH